MPLTDTGTFDGVPVSSPTRTLIDLAAFLPARRLERAVNEAVIEGLVDLEALRELIDRHAFRLTRSELERLFLPIARRAGLPPPETQVRVNGFVVDFFFRELGIVVETDGGRFHSSPPRARPYRRRTPAAAVHPPAGEPRARAFDGDPAFGRPPARGGRLRRGVRRAGTSHGAAPRPTRCPNLGRRRLLRCTFDA